MVLTHKYFEGVVPSNENQADYDMLATGKTNRLRTSTTWYSNLNSEMPCLS